MTRFEILLENMEKARLEKRNGEINRRLAESLQNRTKEEVVAQMLGELTIVVGSGTVLSTAKRWAKRPQMLADGCKTLDFCGEKV